MNDLTILTQLGGWVTAHWETALYVVYFTLLGLLAVTELRFPGLRDPALRSRRWPANFLMTALNVVLPPLVPVSMLSVAMWAAQSEFGLLRVVSVYSAGALLATLAFRSLLSWVNHWLNHKVPFLWRLHRVHHSDTHMDVSTTVRFHPLEFVAGLAVMVPATALLGLTPWVLMLYELLDAVLNLFSHANIRLPVRLDRVLRWLIVTPDMHRIHHSAWQPETDSNYGAVFSFWDRVFGTYVAEPREGREEITLGLEEIRGPRVSAFWWQMGSPFVRAYRDEDRAA